MSRNRGDTGSRSSFLHSNYDGSNNPSAFSTSSRRGARNSSTKDGPNWHSQRSQLFGRERENELLSSLRSGIKRNRAQQTTVLLVKGSAGCGKTALMQRQPWKEEGWMFASGACEAPKSKSRTTTDRDPFSGLAEALTCLIQEWTKARTQENDQDALETLDSLLVSDAEVLQKILPKIYKKRGNSVGTSSSGGFPLETAKRSLASASESAKAISADFSSGCSNASTTRKKNKGKQHDSSRHDVAENSDASSDFGGKLEAVEAILARLVAFLVARQTTALMLDNSQWFDTVALSSLQVIVSANISNLLLIISFREIKIDFLQEFQQFLSNIQYTSRRLNLNNIFEFNVQHLNLVAVNEIASAVMLRKDKEETKAFSRILFNKTLGNPESLWQMLDQLRRDRFLEFSFLKLRWEWGSLASLESLAYLSENVADVVASTFEHLSNDAKIVLRVASCLGRTISLDVLVQYFRQHGAQDDDDEDDDSGKNLIISRNLLNVKHQQLESILKEVLISEILSQVNEESSGDTGRPWRSSSYVWSHDKLQAEIYSTIPKSLQLGIHTQLGNTIYTMSVRRHHENDWMVYLAAEQLCRCTKLRTENNSFSVRTVMDGVQAASLCLAAAKLALLKAALFPAVEMLQTGIDNLHREFSNEKEIAWHSHYSLHLEMSSLLAETSCRVGLHDAARKAAEDVLRYAKSLGDKFKAECAILECVTSGNNRDYARGITKSIAILKDYGETIPSRLRTDQLLKECEKVQSSGLLDKFATLSLMKDETSRNIVKILVNYAALYLWKSQTNLELSWWFVLRAIHISSEKGFCENSVAAMSIVGSHLRRNGNLRKAAEYADNSLRLLNRFPERIGSQHALVKSGAVSSVYSSTRLFNLNLEMFLDAYRTGLRTGATEEAFDAITAYAYSYLNVGLPLTSLGCDLLAYGREAEQLGMPRTIKAIFRILRQTTLNLQNEIKDPTFLNGEALDQYRELSKAKGAGRQMTFDDINTFQLMLSVIYNDWSTAESMIRSLDVAREDIFISRSHFKKTYLGVASVIIGRKKGKRKFKILGRKILSSFTEDVKVGAVNSHPVMLMIEALDSPSKESYETALKGSARLGLVQQEAILCEQAARFFLDKNDEYLAEFYLSRAVSCYRDWGASAKCDSLRNEFPDYLQEGGNQRGTASADPNGRTHYTAAHSAQYREASFTSFRRLTVNAGPTAWHSSK